MKAPQRISRISTLAMIATALLLLGVFVFPLWVIHLQAPQYPQGLGIHIWINKIDGAAPHDLQNINGLNHYIGMMSIEPGEIPELRFMQYFAIGLAFLAALVAALRRRWALLAWVIIAVSLSGIGLYDFYQWEYNYGHNLNPEAAIKIEGMSYQPPMFGTKQLLNFHTTAWPGVGGILAMLGVGLSVLALGYEFVVRPRRGQSGPDQAPRPVSSRAAALVSLAMLAVLASGCSKEPLAIAFGTDACEYCAMTISNERYGAAFVTSRGRTHKFDSVECMLQAQMPGEKFADSKIHMMYAVPYEFKGTLLPIDKVIFLVSEDMPSPMGANITAFSSKEDAEHVQEIKGGEIMGFDALKVHATQKVHS